MHCPPRHWPSSSLSPLDPFGLIQEPLPCYPLRKEVFLWVPTPRPEARGRGGQVITCFTGEPGTSEHSPNTVMGLFLLVHKWPETQKG